MMLLVQWASRDILMTHRFVKSSLKVVSYILYFYFYLTLLCNYYVTLHAKIAIVWFPIVSLTVKKLGYLIHTWTDFQGNRYRSGIASFECMRKIELWCKKVWKTCQIFLLYIYLMLVCLSVCLFVSNKRQTAEPIGPKFCVLPQNRWI